MAFEVTLPELFTVSSQEYEALHGVWLKAVKVLPDYTVVHKQDIFVQEQYRSDIGKDDLSFLSRSFERHFNERPFLHHTCYLFITKTTRVRKAAVRATLQYAVPGLRSSPKELQDKDTDDAAFWKLWSQFGQYRPRERAISRLERRLGSGRDCRDSRICRESSNSYSHTVTVQEDSAI